MIYTESNYSIHLLLLYINIRYYYLLYYLLFALLNNLVLKSSNELQHYWVIMVWQGYVHPQVFQVHMQVLVCSMPPPSMDLSWLLSSCAITFFAIKSLLLNFITFMIQSFKCLRNTQLKPSYIRESWVSEGLKKKWFFWRSD